MCAHVEELIEGRAPGVQVIRRSDGTFSLRIRGTTPPLGRNEPLIVIDGTPVFEQRVGQALAALTPQDVLRIDTSSKTPHRPRCTACGGAMV